MSLHSTTLIVGASAAGYSCTMELSRGPNQRVVLIDQSPFMPYNVCRLTALIRNECAVENIHLPLSSTVEYHPATTLRAIDSTSQRVVVETTEGTRTIPYDRLVLALGTRATMPPFTRQTHCIPAIPFHTLSDAHLILSRVSLGSRIAVIGGGINGVELAAALCSRGVRVVLVERAAHCLPHLPPEVGLHVAHILEQRGSTVICGQAVDKLTPQGIHINGTEYLVDCAIVAAGVAPATDTIEFECQRTAQGEIITTEQGATSVANISASGDCAALRESGKVVRPTYRWGTAIAQGIALGRTLRGITQQPLRPPTTSTAQVGPLIITWSGSYHHDNFVEKIQSDKSMRWCWYDENRNVAGFVQMSMLGGTEVLV